MTKSKDYVRVCSRCGLPRYLPKSLAKAKRPSQRQLRGTTFASRNALGRRAKARHSMTAMALTQQQQRVEEAASCPICGATDFVQYKPGEYPA